ncbi:hypothetical protein F2P56_032687 [Juglans regia]|uniref:RNase H type-1 domain-containing protein n=1 Tax=Juglans regia TaxID=51240 RepID=A0A833X7X4_JUGRE|nr:hypothetical protein F2P56_032687 [Juglans regia]
MVQGLTAGRAAIASLQAARTKTHSRTHAGLQWNETRSRKGQLKTQEMHSWNAEPGLTQNLLVGWEKPPTGVLKLNVDGAIFKDQHRARVGIIFRDAAGDVILAASKKEYAVNDLAKVELLAMLRGLQLCLPVGIEELILESDSLMMATQLEEEEESWFLGNIIMETKQLMAKFRCCTIQHVGQVGNEAAHNLARHAWHVDDIVTWWDSCPDFVWVDKSM